MARLVQDSTASSQTLSPVTRSSDTNAEAAGDVPDDCRRCGVCCFSASQTYVRVSGDDWTRLGTLADEFAHFVGHLAYMRMHAGHCAALRLGRDDDGAGEFFCTVYERRPQACRDLARGSPECGGERATKHASILATHGPPRRVGSERQPDPSAGVSGDARPAGA